MSRPLLSLTLLMALGLLLHGHAASAQASTSASALASAPVSSSSAGMSSFDGVVEAVRHTVVAAQVAGAVTSLEVRAGDPVKAGQVLARIDARAPEQQASASDAQWHSAQALLDVAAKDLQRQQQLFAKQYISQAALDRAEAQYKAAQAQAAAQRAQAGAARTTAGLHVLRAPFAGIVAEVPVAVGDMALPGKPLVVLYEPGALRVSAALPQSLLGTPAAGLRLEFAGLPEAQRWYTPDAAQLQWLPTVDPATHTVQLRIALPAAAPGLVPGLFARVWLPLPGADKAARLFVPASAVVRRAGMSGLYVVDAQGRAQLRQVRLGRVQGEQIEVLSGVSAGERVALEPQAAARAH